LKIGFNHQRRDSNANNNVKKRYYEPSEMNEINLEHNLNNINKNNFKRNNTGSELPDLD